MTESNSEVYSHLVQSLESEEGTVFLTGAGLSAESGISTFRGEDGLWSDYDPSEVATPEAFRKQPEKVRSFYRMRRRRLSDVKPSKAHRVMASLDEYSPDVRVLTQNVDNLHERADQSRVLHVHGRLMRDRCQNCDRRFDARPDSEEFTCPNCGGKLRPDVVWFGESLDSSCLKQSREWLQTTDCLVVVGTSLEVAPVSRFPRTAYRAGADLIEVNPEPVLADQFRDVMVYEGGANDFFEALEQELNKSSGTETE